MAFRLPTFTTRRRHVPRHAARSAPKAPRPMPAPAPANLGSLRDARGRGRARAGTAGYVSGPIGQPRPSKTPARTELERRATRTGLPGVEAHRRSDRPDPYARERELMGQTPRGRGRKGPSGAVPARVEVGRRAARSDARGRPAFPAVGRAPAPDKRTARGYELEPGTQRQARRLPGTGHGPVNHPQQRTSGREFDPGPRGSQGGHAYFRRGK